MYVDAPLRGTFSTNVQRTGRFKPSALSATIIVAALFTGGYGIYHYVSGDVASDGRQEMSQASVAAEPTPTKAIAEVPTPSPNVVKVQAPSPNPTAVVTPPPRTNSGRRDRREENPPPANRPRQDDRRLADGHFEKAQALYQQGQYKAALSELREAIKLNPRHGKALGLQREINKLIGILNSR
jgi:Flp pilus assembly protein TadD